MFGSDFRLFDLGFLLVFVETIVFKSPDEGFDFHAFYYF